MINNKYLKIIIYNLLSTFIIFSIVFLIIFIIEIISGKYLSKNRLDCSYLHCNANYNYVNRTREATMQKNYDTFYDIVYQKDKYGFRGKRKQISKIDILTVGGSTTDEKFLNLENTWSHKLEENFKRIDKNIDVVSAGIDGQSSHGHIWNLKNWFPKIENFKTKYIIYYMGINENLKKKPDTVFDLNKDNLTKINQIKFYIQRNNGLLYKTYNIFRKKYYNLYLNSGYQPLLPKYSKIKNTFTPNIKHKNNLVKNLSQIKKLTEELNATPIFVTQRTQFWKEINGEILLANNVIYNNKDHYNYEKFIAKTIINFCQENDLVCIDIFNNIKFDEEDHFELAHTTAKGSKKIADYIFKKLIQNFKF